MKHRNRNTKFWRELEKCPPPRPAFSSFEETESIVRKGLTRGGISDCGWEYAPEVGTGLHGLYVDARGEWEKTGDLKRVLTAKLRTKDRTIIRKEAAEALVNLTLEGVKCVALLYKKNPEICREVARTMEEWPVSADLGERSWQRKAENTVADLKLGSAIGGFILSDRTATENPIRWYATVIYQTLFQSRYFFKNGDQRVYTRQGCPPWAEKTLALPRFIKPQVRAWAVLGKEMLLEQRPNFIEDEALKEQKFKWTKRAENRSKSGKPTLRAIQNEAFDDFAKELRKLAPAENIYRGEW
ncbi:MAG TPA: hypothetical protein VMB22_06375 [Verrucomicrobiae bacterium]|nr:hypothetical protein [Verrucomicrobiae bacterium]